MACPGLHCPGCSEGQTLGLAGGAIVLLALADAAVPWIADRIWWIAGTVALCFALAVAAGMWLERWSDRRGARWGAAHGIRSRADAIRLDSGPGIREPLTHPARDALPAPQVVNINFFGAPSAAQAEMIRRAIAGVPGRGGDDAQS